MLVSESRVLTTHAGSLPRPAGARRAARPAQPRRDGRRRASCGAAVEAATADVIAAQVEAGIDVGNDGEQARESFFTYVQHRMTGFGGTQPPPADARPARAPRLPRAGPSRASTAIKVNLMHAPAAIGEVTYRDTDRARRRVRAGRRRAVRRDVHDRGVARHRRRRRWRTATTRRARSTCDAVADGAAHRVPGHRRPRAAAADRRARPGHGAPHAVRRPPARRVPRLGRAGRSTPSTAPSTGIDPADVRLHVCWGNYEGPHTHDVPLDDIQPLLYEAHVGALVRVDGQRPPRPRAPLLRAPPAARRHGPRRRGDRHDEQLRRAPRGGRRPAGRGWPGPSAIPRRVIAGTDCGFDTSAGIGDVAPSLVWEKLRALRAGADLASDRLF